MDGTKTCKICNETKDITEIPKGRTCKSCVRMRRNIKTPSSTKRCRIQLHYKEIMLLLHTFVKIYECKPRNKIDFDCYYIDCKRLLKIINKEDKDCEGL